MGNVRGSHFAGLGRRHLVWVSGMGSKAGGNSGSDGFWCMAGSLPACFTRILVFIHKRHQAVISVY